MRTGTHHFRSEREAIAYYGRQEIGAPDVREKIANREIEIGRPAAIPQNSEFQWDRDGRGWIVENAGE